MYEIHYCNFQPTKDTAYDKTECGVTYFYNKDTYASYAVECRYNAV